MKIAVLDTTIDGAATVEAQFFLPKLLKGLSGKGNELHLIAQAAPNDEVFRRIEESNAILHTNFWQADGLIEETAPVLANCLNELKPDIYLIWNSADIGWVVLPRLDPQIAALAVGHEDSEYFYHPARHYRSFLTRVIGTTPEVCIGYVLSSVIEKEKVEWIPFSRKETEAEISEAENDRKIIENYVNCFEKAIEDARAAPRETYDDYPLMPGVRSRLPLWLRRLKAKMSG